MRTVHALARLAAGADVVTSADAALAGVSPSALRWAVSSGALHRMRPGVYVLHERWTAADTRERHRLSVLAAVAGRPEAVAVAQSAAALHGLPLPAGPPSTPLLVVPRDASRAGGRGRTASRVGRRAWLDDDEVVTLPDGVRVTSPARTVVDCARHLDRGWALAVADAARTRCRADDLSAAAARNPRAPGHRAAVWVADHADPRAESPLESLARAVVLLGGHPAPTPQVWVRTARGGYRVDLLDERAGVVIEADGRLKYAGPEDLWAEKRREDALRDAGCEVIRFTMTDHVRPRVWLARYEQVLFRAARRTSHA